MRGKMVQTFALAVACGLVAMYGVSQMVGTPAPAKPEMQEVVVAARDIKVEEVLTEELVKVIELPKSAVPEGSFSEVGKLKTRWARIPLLANEPVVEAKLAEEGEPPGLVGRIPPGMRAFAVEVNEGTGVSGFILPDHCVDVIQTRTESKPGRLAREKGETILQNIRVLAAGQVTTRPDDKTIQVRTVTLAVTPRQVETLVAAKAKGSLSLALRGIEDKEVVEPESEPESEPEPMPQPMPIPPPVIVQAPEPERRVRYKETHLYMGFAPTGVYHSIQHRGRPIVEGRPDRSRRMKPAGVRYAQSGP